jgi:hypothetical protein
MAGVVDRAPPQGALEKKNLCLPFANGSAAVGIGRPAPGSCPTWFATLGSGIQTPAYGSARVYAGNFSPSRAKTVLGCTILAAMSWLTECWVLREASVQHHSSGRVHQRRPLRQSPLRCFYRVSIFHQPRSSTIVRRHSQNARSCLRPGYQIQFASPARSCCRRALLPPLRYVSYYLNL